MASYLWNSVKGMLGYDTLETESAGVAEDKVTNANTEERKSLWKQLSSYIGKDVTSMISLPVWIFEPLSFLQIMCEPMQYSELLNKAAESPDSANRMAYLIAFITAGYSQAVRQKKPFNPILGETYEFVPPNKNYKFFAEQVSHHPPIGVSLITGDKYLLQLEMELTTKFRGNSSDVFVHGMNAMNIPKYGDEFVWGHLDTCAHNVIVGWMWVDHFGTLEVHNKTTGDKGLITFSRSGWLGAGRFELAGDITDKNGKLRLRVRGKWNEAVYAIKIDKEGNESAPILIWKKPLKQPDNKWGWPKFTENLNFMSEAYKTVLPPTDSRIRGDRLALEKEDLELAASEKVRLEEKQRGDRKDRENKSEEWEPKYFKKVDDAEHGHKYVYVGKYWEEREERFKVAGYKEENDKSVDEKLEEVTKAVEEVTVKEEDGKQEVKQ